MTLLNLLIAHIVSMTTWHDNSIFPSHVFHRAVALDSVTLDNSRVFLEAMYQECTKVGEAYDPASFYGLHLCEPLAPLLRHIALVLDELLYDILGFNRNMTSFHVGRCWPVIRTNAAGTSHYHNASVFSAVYYLDCPPSAGGLQFTSPVRTRADTLYREGAEGRMFWEHGVNSGDLIVFNSELVHRALEGHSVSSSPLMAVALDLFSSTDMRNVTGGAPHSQYLRSLADLRAHPARDGNETT